MRMSVLVIPMKSAAGTPLPQTSPTPKAMRPSSSRMRSKKSPPTSRAGVIDADTSTPVSAANSLDLRQERTLNDGRARHFVVALAAQDDLLGHAAEGLAEIGEVRDRIAQLIEQGGVEFMALERAERVGVEADRAIDPAHALAHPADDVDEHGRGCACDFCERGAPDAQGGDLGACAHGRGPGQLRKRARLADETGGLDGRNGDDAPSAVGGDGHFPRQDQHDRVGLFPLGHENRVRREGPQIAGIDQKRDVVFGEVAERARRPYGDAQPR